MPPTDSLGRSQASSRVRRGVLHALSALAPLGAAAGEVYVPLESYMAQLKAAVLAASSSDLFDVINDMRAARVSGALIAESYIPNVARWLGEAWLADEIQFTTVTIACSRLQTLVRRLDGAWGDMPEVKFANPPVFQVGIPEGVQHSLGATILAGHLRSRGYCVHLDLEMTVEGIAEKVRHVPLSGIFLSISDVDQLECFDNVIQSVKNAASDLPVILGGALLLEDVDIRPFCQADLITGDIDEALRFCRVSVENEEIMIDLEDSPMVTPLREAEHRGVKV